MSRQVCSGSSSARPKLKDPGVGGHDVEPAEPGHPVVQRLLDRGVVADVGLGGDDPPAGRLDLPGRLGQVLHGGHRVGHRVDLLGDVHRDDVRALAGQRDRVAAALPARRPGDEGDLAFQPSGHGVVSLPRDEFLLP
jgi:hypothetical protein